MGLTVTAAGTSLPNLFASLIVAKQGLGNMSVSNAFGSNTFNIFVALAFPWSVGCYMSKPTGLPHRAHVMGALCSPGSLDNESTSDSCRVLLRF